jgi:hypothetical protein
MSSDLDPESFEGFLRWLGEPKCTAGVDWPDPSPEVLAAARMAWQEFQEVRRLHRAELEAQVRGGTYREELELLAAADADRGRWLPRLRTPNGFAISALYAGQRTPESAPVALLVECPAELVELFKGQQVHIAAGGRWVEIGEIDVDGKATGDLPEGIDFKPPFAFRIGKLEEHPEELPDPAQPQ